MIAIIDYGAGNSRSVQNMLRAVGASSYIASTPQQLEQASKIILPGVGHFDFGMKSLRQRGFESQLNELVIEKGIPVLGICLGAQLLTRASEEGKSSGLGWIAADTVRFRTKDMATPLPVPHMGWADTHSTASHPLFREVEEPARFYFVHSFHILCDDPQDEICNAEYGYRFTAGVGRGNVMGVQFHPEKSHRFGRKLLQSFAFNPHWNQG